MSERRQRILLVEDDDDHAELVGRALADLRLPVELVRLPDGAQALDFLHRRPPFADATLPDVILLDLRLPRVDGLEVLEQIKATTELQAVPVVVMTTSAAERDLVRAYGSRVNAYVVKPVDVQVLQQMVRDIGMFWLAWNRRP